MGPPDKKKSPKEWRKYLDKQNVRRARQRTVEKEKKFKEELRPLIRQVLRRALKGWSHSFDEHVIRANAIMRKNAALQRCKEELMQRVIKRSAGRTDAACDQEVCRIAVGAKRLTAVS